MIPELRATHPRGGRSLPHSDWSRLLTESRNPRSLNLDRMATEKVVTLLLDEDRLALIAAKKKARDIASAARLVAKAFSTGGRTLFVGAGTSGRLGVLEAAECPPTFGTRPEMILGIMAGGEDAVFRAKEGSEDRADLGEGAVSAVTSKDVVVGISASSVTPFVRAALKKARSRRAKTVLVTCAPQTRLKTLANVVIAIRTGPEVLTGSTRLKAGSATKAVLNAITTAAMIRLGKSYSNYMVDLKQTSKKLEDRARRIVAVSTGVNMAEADRLLRAADNEVKTAIVMGHLRLDAPAARRKITLANGHVRKAVSDRRRR
ncbi:MAG: N-acetylmuramic acid 6-phosphate etherase [Vicinamibacteria bacterium]|nr:N-acetylmuramic acid 6-phosphate etherase [Vicinamibacteria bacterium]